MKNQSLLPTASLPRRFAKSRAKSLLCAFALALGFAAPAMAACIVPQDATTIIKGMAQWTNEERAAAKLGTLTYDEKLTKAAQFHACNMAKRDFFDHDAPGGPTFKRRVKREGYRLSTAVENLGRSTEWSIAAPVRMWKNSKSHYVNTMNPAITQMGFGVALDDKGRSYYVFIGAAPR